MKLAYLLDTYPSVSETFIAREIDALRRLGAQVEIFALHPGAGAHEFRVPTRANMLRQAQSLVMGDAAFAAWGAAWWRSQGYGEALRDVQHIHGGFASYPAYIAWGAADVAGLRWSFSGHARDLFVGQEGLGEKLRHAAFASVCTQPGRDLLIASAPECADKVLYAPHGIEIGEFEYRTWETGPVRLLAVGRLVEKKGFDDLLDSVAIVAKQIDVEGATIIGEGPLLHELEQQARRLRIEKLVNFPGRTSQPEVRAAMAKANCFVLPCKVAADGDRDGLPNVIPEAAACGLPVVSTRTGGVTDFLDESCGRLCEAGDSAALAKEIEDVFAQPQETLMRCIAARRKVDNKFEVNRNVSILYERFKATIAAS